IKEKILIALDVDTIEEAKTLISELKDYAGIFKIGLQLYMGCGIEIFKFMKEQNIKFFFDAKLHDIPNTVAKASENIIKNGASFFNIHTMGGEEMMRAASEAARKTAKEAGYASPLILGVTVLTSINEECLKNELKIPYKPEDYVINLAEAAKRSGLDGVVASVWEAKRIKQVCGKDFKVLCPGIRPDWACKNDQKRLATPRIAIKEGADYLVIGRAVTSASDRVKAIQLIHEEIENAILTQNKSYAVSKGKLLLENGMIFEGESIGADGTSFGEIVFNTSMSGYQEILTDPSYAGQTIVMTYPEIGNYGINRDDFESGKIYARGFIVKNMCEHESHYKSYISVSDYLKQNNIIGLKGVDTRHLTQIIRNYGAMNCALTTGDITREIKEKVREYKINKDITLDVTTYKIERYSNSGIKLAIVDTGIKKSIFDNFRALNCNITMYPADAKADEILKENYDAVLFSNGPGNPQDAVYTIKTAENLLGKIRLFGICLGHQIISLALGGKTYKLKYGHRGGNHPVMNTKTGEIIITSQNHSYAVDSDSLPLNTKASYINLNDNTIEGIECEEYKIKTVQFHPELTAGPYDANKIIIDWVHEIEELKRITV
ncbi:MAG: glutamine-hydrolyzing carbamoyl-phosphate synthase small subunit, partial [Candidatus Gastranaerophilales bacterium]|nr:glutamine-hydrolyzing carbamoyl-phosphate synthase small subunit [Candidatus Gastranaerophilales bacterium]